MSTPLTKVDSARIRNSISDILGKYAAVSPSQVIDLIPIKDLKGKLYEAHVLSRIIENLHTKEGVTFKLAGANPTKLTLKRKGSDIDRTYAYFKVERSGVDFGEIYTDMYFNTLSFRYIKGAANAATFHELDIAMVPPNSVGRPDFNDLMLAVECKATLMQKSIWREILGFRKEMGGRYWRQKATGFNFWPATHVNNNPGSIHLLYCTDSCVNTYQDVGEYYGILVENEPL